MDLSKWFVLSLILTSLEESFLMVLWLLSVRLRGSRQNVHYAYRMLHGVQLSYFVGMVYLLIRCLWEGRQEEYSAFAVSSPLLQRVLWWVFLAWCAGVLWGIVSQGYTYYRFREMKQAAVPAPLEEQAIVENIRRELGISRKMRVYMGYAFESPCIVGVFHPAIYLPVIPFRRDELEIIFYHELVHYLQGDTFWKPFFGIVRNFYWFNPLSVKLQKETVRWTEANCDFYCCAERFGKREYFRLLYDVGCDQKRSSICGYVPMWRESNSELKWRIQCMKMYEMKKIGARMGAVITAASVLFGGVSAHAATLGVESLYTQSLFRTVQSEEDTTAADGTTLAEGEDLTEYTGGADYFDGITVLPGDDVDESDDGISVASTVKSIDNWTVKNNSAKYSAEFTMKKGAEVSVAVNIKPTNKTVEVGIVKPNGNTIYVKGKGGITHTFTAPVKGDYRVYVKNTSGTKVTVDGVYIPN